MRIKILAGALLLVLLALVFVQYKLNKTINTELQETKDELNQLKENINDSIIKQNEITEKLNNVKKESYANTQKLNNKLNSLPSMKVEERKQVLDTEYLNIIECIEKTTLGDKQC